MNEIKNSPVKGYTDQNQNKILEVNHNKDLEEAILARLDQLVEDPVLRCDGRWLSIARTHIEEGFMAMNRAVFKPQRVK